MENIKTIINQPASKSLSEITDDERAALFPVILSEYNPNWTSWYTEEKAELERIISKDNIVRISHYGSTSVPGLLAKPTVDILLEITDNTDIDKLIENMKAAGGYICIHNPTVPNSPPPHLMFMKGYTSIGFAEKVYHIHVRYHGEWDELNFRDYLIAHPGVAAEYAELKKQLLEKYEFNRDGYTDAKGEFIRAVTEKAKKNITLIYGTGNKGKLQSMRKYLSKLPINIFGLNDITTDYPAIDESGNDPLENARIKAFAYYKTIGVPVFSCDSGLFIKDAPNELQPGVHVRNINGKYLDDEEMITHYATLSSRLGGNITVRYKNAICLVMSEEKIYEYMGDDIAGEEFILASNPHQRRTVGFPLDSLSVHIKSGKYYYDLDELKSRSSMEEGFHNFFKSVLKLKE